MKYSPFQRFLTVQRLPLPGNLAAALGKFAVAHQVGHLRRRQQCGEVERTDERVGADEVEVIRVPLAILDHAVVVLVATELVLHDLLDAGPVLRRGSSCPSTSGARDNT